MLWRHPTSSCICIQVRHFVSTEENAQQLLVKTRHNLSDCEVAGSSKRLGEEKKLRLGAKELSDERSFGQESHRNKERLDHSLVYYKHFCGG